MKLKIHGQSLQVIKKMQNLIENLKNLSNQILLAKKVDDYDKIISIDKSRKVLIDQIFQKA